MLHDDGQHTDGLEHADVVLVGISRTSKTPTSIYLANRGVKTANVPLVPGMPIPIGLDRLRQPLVVGLYASAERIVQIRQNRLLGLKARAAERSLCRSRSGRRRGRVLAPALRQAQLAIDRRDASLHRGNRRRRFGAAGRAAPSIGLLIWLCGVPRCRSCSPRRARFVARCWRRPGFRSSRTADIDERAVESGAGLDEPGCVVALLAREKAKKVAVRAPDRLVVGADQTLSLAGRRFSKPADRMRRPRAAAGALRTDPRAPFGRGGHVRRIGSSSRMWTWHD